MALFHITLQLHMHSGVARNSQWWGLGAEQPPKAIGGLGAKSDGLGAKLPAAGGKGAEGGVLAADPPVLGDFCNFSIKITNFYAYVVYAHCGQNSYFKAISH